MEESLGKRLNDLIGKISSATKPQEAADAWAAWVKATDGKDIPASWGGKANAALSARARRMNRPVAELKRMGEKQLPKATEKTVSNKDTQQAKAKERVETGEATGRTQRESRPPSRQSRRRIGTGGRRVRRRSGTQVRRAEQRAAETAAAESTPATPATNSDQAEPKPNREANRSSRQSRRRIGTGGRRVRRSGPMARTQTRRAGRRNVVTVTKTGDEAVDARNEQLKELRAQGRITADDFNKGVSNSKADPQIADDIIAKGNKAPKGASDIQRVAARGGEATESQREQVRRAAETPAKKAAPKKAGKGATPAPAGVENLTAKQAHDRIQAELKKADPNHVTKPFRGKNPDDPASPAQLKRLGISSGGQSAPKSAPKKASSGATPKVGSAVEDLTKGQAHDEIQRLSKLLDPDHEVKPYSRSTGDQTISDAQKRKIEQLRRQAIEKGVDPGRVGGGSGSTGKVTGTSTPSGKAPGGDGPNSKGEAPKNKPNKGTAKGGGQKAPKTKTLADDLRGGFRVLPNAQDARLVAEGLARGERPVTNTGFRFVDARNVPAIRSEIFASRGQNPDGSKMSRRQQKMSRRQQMVSPVADDVVDDVANRQGQGPLNRLVPESGPAGRLSAGLPKGVGGVVRFGLPAVGALLADQVTGKVFEAIDPTPNSDSYLGGALKAVGRGAVGGGVAGGLASGGPGALIGAPIGGLLGLGSYVLGGGPQNQESLEEAITNIRSEAAMSGTDPKLTNQIIGRLRLVAGRAQRMGDDERVQNAIAGAYDEMSGVLGTPAVENPFNVDVINQLSRSSNEQLIPLVQSMEGPYRAAALNSLATTPMAMYSQAAQSTIDSGGNLGGMLDAQNLSNIAMGM
jgi:hypothetical protein